MNKFSFFAALLTLVASGAFADDHDVKCKIEGQADHVVVDSEEVCTEQMHGEVVNDSAE